MAVMTIALGVSVAAGMLNLVFNIGDQVARELKTYGANINIRPKTEKISPYLGNIDFDPLAASSFLNEDDLYKVKMIFWRNNVLAFTPYLWSRAQTSVGQAAVAGTWFRKDLRLAGGSRLRTGMSKTRPWITIAGAWPNETGRQAEALIGSKLAGKLGVKAGDRRSFELAGRPLRIKIAGVLSSGDQLDESLVVPLSFLQERLRLAGKISEAEVTALAVPENDLSAKYQRDPDSLTGAEWEKWYCTPYVDSISFQIEEAVAGSTAKPFRQVAHAEGLILSKIQLLILLLALAAVVSTAIAISSLMTAIVLERGREIGLLKALGATDFLVVLVFLGEAIVLGLLGGTVGYGLGLAFVRTVSAGVFGSGAQIKTIMLPATLGLSIFIALVGSLAAVRVIAALNPKEALHG